MKVLIVDDNANNLELVRASLEREDWEVVGARDGLKALVVLEAESVDAIVSDILMPNMDGYRLCREVRRRPAFSQVPFIFYTGTYNSVEDKALALKVGADKCLTKDSPVTDILKAIHEIMSRGEPSQKAVDHSLGDLDLVKSYSESLVQKLKTKNCEMAEVEAKFRCLVEQGITGIYIIQDDCFVYANPKMKKMLGYSTEELRAQPTLDFIFPADRTLVRENLEKRLRGEVESVHYELRMVRKDGTVLEAEVHGGLAEYNGRPAVMGTLLDITERKRLEAQFIESQKMEVLGHLAGGVAHDFNNILAVITCSSEMVIGELGPQHPQVEQIEEIRLAAERAAGLTRQLLIFSRKQAIESVVLNVNEVVTSLDKMLRRLIDENIELIIAPGIGAGCIKANSGYIGQVVMNLAINARDAMPQGGKLTITTSNVKRPRREETSHPEAQPKDYVMVAIQDTGTGMTDQVKSQLFQAFFTTKAKGKGTGLGLVTCQSIVNQCGGHIEVESAVGKGTVFKVYFPQVRAEAENKTRTSDASQLPRGTETVLVVEDEPAVRNLASRVLLSQGYEVLTASNGREGLNVAQNHNGAPISLVITDVIMPKMSGKVMADWLKSTYPDLKILFTSGYTDDTIANHNVQETGMAFLSKPYTMASLTWKVREVLDVKNALSLP